MRTLFVILATLVFGKIQGFADIPLLISHRGESSDAPENTMAAFRLSRERGIDGFECDVYLTADKRVVCLHDKNLKRTTGLDKGIKQAKWPEISKLSAGRWKGEKFAGQGVPLLSEILTLAQEGFLIYVEVKDGVEIIPYLEKIIAVEPKATPARVVFISFNREVVRTLRRTLPAYRAYLLCGIKRDKSGKPRPSAPELVKILRKLGASGVDIGFTPDVGRDYVRTVKEAGFSFHVWTIDRPSRARAARKAGVDSITTNSGMRLREAFRKNKGAVPEGEKQRARQFSSFPPSP